MDQLLKGVTGSMSSYTTICNNCDITQFSDYLYVNSFVRITKFKAPKYFYIPGKGESLQPCMCTAVSSFNSLRRSKGMRCSAPSSIV